MVENKNFESGAVNGEKQQDFFSKCVSYLKGAVNTKKEGIPMQDNFNKVCTETFVFDDDPNSMVAENKTLRSPNHNAHITSQRPVSVIPKTVAEQKADPKADTVLKTLPDAEKKTAESPKPAAESQKTAPVKNSAGNYELVYIVDKDKKSDNFIITGITTGTVAHALGMCHLTVIIVPYVSTGIHKGKMIIHDRYPKLAAKGELKNQTLSYSLLGGHCTADLSQIGQPVTEEVCMAHARRELKEGFLLRGNAECKKKLEVWEDGIKTNKTIGAEAYNAKELIPVGITSYNAEYSYYFALPVPEEDLIAPGTDLIKSDKESLKLIVADNYMSDGVEKDVYLPIYITTEIDLLKLPYTNPDSEICDAISRLWRPENADVYNKLRKYIL